jgi:hypothetical protein
MTAVCAWCKSPLREDEGKGDTEGICDACLDAMRSGRLRLGKTLTSGLCPKCMIRFVWNTQARLKRAYCPFCSTRLKRTSHQFRRGISVGVEKPTILRLRSNHGHK